jgi:hypothetical protein
MLLTTEYGLPSTQGSRKALGFIGHSVYSDGSAAENSMRVAVAVVVLLLISGCGQHPRIDISPTVEGGQVVFHVPFSGVNGLLKFAVKDGETMLWDVTMSYDKGHKIVYGVLPTGGNMPAKQVFPPPGQAPRDIRGRTVTVCVEYQYDDGFSACCRSFKKVVEVP